MARGSGRLWVVDGEMNEKRDDADGADERSGTPEVSPLSEAALERLRESASAPGAGAEFAELVRAFTALEAQRLAALAAAQQQQAFAAGQQQAIAAGAERTRPGVPLVGGRLGMLLAIGVTVGSTALAVTYYGGSDGRPPPKEATRLVISQSAGPGPAVTPTAGPSPGPSAPSVPAGGGTPGGPSGGPGGVLGGVPGGAAGTPPRSSESASAGPAASATPTVGATPSAPTTSSPAPSPATTSVPQLGPTRAKKLCRRWRQGKLLPGSPGLVRLTAAAGGPAKIETYCAGVAAASKKTPASGN